VLCEPKQRTRKARLDEAAGSSGRDLRLLRQTGEGSKSSRSNGYYSYLPKRSGVPINTSRAPEDLDNKELDMLI
jgi:hypothetical protein